MIPLVRRLLALLDNVEGTYTCRCGRGLKVGLSGELWQTKLLIKAKLHEGCNTGDLDNPEATPTSEEGTRFSLIEVD